MTWSTRQSSRAAALLRYPPGLKSVPSRSPTSSASCAGSAADACGSVAELVGFGPHRWMDVSALLREHGGSAWTRDLLRHCSRRDLAEAVQVGTVVYRRGRYTLPDHGQPQRIARAWGARARESAAMWHQWASGAAAPGGVGARGRAITDADQVADVRQTDLGPSGAVGASTPLRTALDCARGPPSSRDGSTPSCSPGGW